MKTKACGRCQQIKPTSSFTTHRGTHDGLQVWCNTCMNERVKEWQADNPANIQARTADAVKASERHCAHIANYTLRAINRIEAKGTEAPPQLRAIHQLASSLAQQQAHTIAKRAYCEHCGAQFNKQPNKKYCTPTCRATVENIRRRKPRPLLTKRQRQVLDHRNKGLNLSATGRALGITINTVKEHIEAIQAKGIDVPSTPSDTTTMREEQAA